jgi:hypothetical protein
MAGVALLSFVCNSRSLAAAPGGNLVSQDFFKIPCQAGACKDRLAADKLI